MKTFLKITFSVAFILSAFTATATDSNTTDENSQPKPVIIQDIPVQPEMRPRTPIVQQIECFYESGYLFFEFYIPEGNCTLIITNLQTGTTKQYNFDSSDETQVYVGVLEEAYIEIITASGNTYGGHL